MGLWLTFSEVQSGPNFIQLLGFVFLAKNPIIFGLGSWPIKFSLHWTNSWHPTFSLHRVMDLKETLFFNVKDWAYGFYFLYIINWTHGLLLSSLDGWAVSPSRVTIENKLKIQILLLHEMSSISKSCYFMNCISRTTMTFPASYGESISGTPLLWYKLGL